MSLIHHQGNLLAIEFCQEQDNGVIRIFIESLDNDSQNSQTVFTNTT